MPTKQEVYHSSTLGPIPLSFTGRRLMQNLREAVQALLQKRTEQAARGQVPSQDDWEDVSKARGQLAQYMSKLEKGQSNEDKIVLLYGKPVNYYFNLDQEVGKLRHENEVLRKANEAFKLEEKRQQESMKSPDGSWRRRFAKVPFFALVNELFDRSTNVNVQRNLGNHTINITGAIDEATAQRIAAHMLQRDKEKRAREEEKINTNYSWPPAPRFNSRCFPLPVAPKKNGYLVRVVEKPARAPIRKTNGIIVTELQLKGSMHVEAYSMDDALDTAVRTAKENGFPELTRNDFEVRLVSVPEA